MKLFIIGNGFDLGHGLPTRYWDFRCFLEENYYDFLAEFERAYGLFQFEEPWSNVEQWRNEDRYGREKILWSQFEKNLPEIGEEDLISSCTDLDLELESGDHYIEDMLRDYFMKKYEYIKKLPEYLKQWVESIRIIGIPKCTALINKRNDDIYVTFNYTRVLERTYHIPRRNILHIHGSLRLYDEDPIIGHRDKDCIERIRERKEQADRMWDEKLMAICPVIEEYYRKTLKTLRLSTLENFIKGKMLTEIVVIGHSLADVDLPYFADIDKITGRELEWKVYCYNKDELADKKQRLVMAGVDEGRIKLFSTDQFYNIKNC